MKRNASNEVKRGQAISFRIPSDTPDHLIKFLQKLKETERRNFSSKMAEFVMKGVSSYYANERETVTIPLPQKLTKAQRDWLKHEHSEALLGNILYQLISDPIRSASILASFNSKAIDIDEALFLQETSATVEPDPGEQERKQLPPIDDWADLDDDLDSVDWEEELKIQSSKKGEKEGITESENDIDDLLGGFLASMNK